MDNYVSKDAISNWQHNCKLKKYTSNLFLEFIVWSLNIFDPFYILLNIFHSLTKYVTCLVRNTVHTHILHFKVNRRHMSSSWEVRFFRIFTSNFMLKEPVMVSAFSLFFRKIVSSILKYKNSQRRTRRLCVILEFQICPYT